MRCDRQTRRRALADVFRVRVQPRRRRAESDMCDEVAEDVLKTLQRRYPQFKTTTTATMSCAALCADGTPERLPHSFGLPFVDLVAMGIRSPIAQQSHEADSMRLFGR